MSQEFIERLDRDPEFRRRILERIDRGIEDLRDGDYIELDDDGLKAFFDEIKRKGREKLRRERSRSSDDDDHPALDGD